MTRQGQTWCEVDPGKQATKHHRSTQAHESPNNVALLRGVRPLITGVATYVQRSVAYRKML
jgi:hypothetical protein